MEKKLILVGLGSVERCMDFMNEVVASLRSRAIGVTCGRFNHLTFSTPHTNVLFVSCYYGIPDIKPELRRKFDKVDAVFGSHSTCLHHLAKPNAFIVGSGRRGLVDYICKVEREASFKDSPLKARYEKGERTKELYDAIMACE